MVAGTTVGHLRVAWGCLVHYVLLRCEVEHSAFRHEIKRQNRTNGFCRKCYLPPESKYGLSVYLDTEVHTQPPATSGEAMTMRKNHLQSPSFSFLSRGRIVIVGGRMASLSRLDLDVKAMCLPSNVAAAYLPSKA
jgi:hypothetical protein